MRETGGMWDDPPEWMVPAQTIVTVIVVCCLYVMFYWINGGGEAWHEDPAKKRERWSVLAGPSSSSSPEMKLGVQEKGR